MMGAVLSCRRSCRWPVTQAGRVRNPPRPRLCDVARVGDRVSPLSPAANPIGAETQAHW